MKFVALDWRIFTFGFKKSLLRQNFERGFFIHSHLSIGLRMTVCDDEVAPLPWWIFINLLFRWSQPVINDELDDELVGRWRWWWWWWWLSSSARASSTTSTEEEDEEMDCSLSLLDHSQSSWAIASTSLRISNVSFCKRIKKTDWSKFLKNSA